MKRLGSLTQEQRKVSEDWNKSFEADFPEGVKEPTKKPDETDVEFNNRVYDYKVSIGLIKLFIDENE